MFDVEDARENITKFDLPEREYCRKLLDEIEQLQAENESYKTTLQLIRALSQTREQEMFDSIIIEIDKALKEEFV